MIMQRLRAETAALHTRVEAILDPDARFATRTAYVDLLHLLHPFYRRCEAVLSKLPWHEIGFDLDARRKSHLLAADLRSLGSTVSEAKVDAECPICIDLASGLGTMYVLEGATLGGRILRKQLRERFDIDASNGGSFYEGYGAETERLWKEFGSAAEGYCGESPQRCDSAAAAATATFTAIGRLLTPSGDDPKL